MTNVENEHISFMQEALKEAQKAYADEEVPIGAIVVIKNKIIARAYNQTEKLKDPTAHAEMIAITQACNYLGGKYLKDCKIYVTLEPCIMCAGALKWAQISDLIYAADDPKTGFSQVNYPILHPKTKITKGILCAESESLLKKFFKSLR
jgi:tRNA(adenine34) deaminase